LSEGPRSLTGAARGSERQSRGRWRRWCGRCGKAGLESEKENVHMKTQIDKKRFGPWALVTGASSGIGREFARQLAASGLNVVLVARRESLLDEVGQGIAKDFNVQYRTVVADLSQDGFLDQLAEATKGLSTLALWYPTRALEIRASSSRLIGRSWRASCGLIL
jgi:short chain dehydrogenase